MISANGIFWPAVVVDGAVAGKWRRSRQEDGLVVAAELFHPIAAKRAIISKAGELGDFLGATHTTVTITGGKKKVNSKQS